MNNRSSVNETNLVNFSADLSTLNQLDTKDSLLSFPFDHIYACHSDNSERRQTLQLDKEVEISTHCVAGEDKNLVANSTTEINRLKGRLASAENLNNKLKDLLIYHLDLIQQQNELINKREKVYQALKQENDTLKTRLNRSDRRHSANTNASLVHVPAQTVTSTVVKSEPGTAPQIMLNSFTELILPDTGSIPNSFIFDTDLNKKSFGQDTYEIARSSETDVTNFLSSDLGVSSILDNNLNSEEYTMIESKRSLSKKDVKAENRPDSPYPAASNRIQRSKRRTSSSLTSLSRTSKSPGTKVENPETSKVLFEDDKSFDRTFSVNKKSKMINTYGKSRSSTATSKRTSQFTGSLSDRLQLIDTTPTGEDPYQLGEDDMREQSPIPKLMLQKTNHGRIKICTDALGESTITSRRLYNPIEDTKATEVDIDDNKYNLPNPYMHPTELKEKTIIVMDPDLDLVKTEPEIDWRIYNSKQPGTETSLCDFSYGETTNNLATSILPGLVESRSLDLQELFNTVSPLNLDSLNTDADFSVSTDKSPADKSKRRGTRTISLLGQEFLGEEAGDGKRSADSKRGRKRALSTAGLLKNIKTVQKGGAAKPKSNKGKASCRGKKSPVPGMVTKEPYHTTMGDPDVSWYLGLDPDVKLEDVDQSGEQSASTVEVPRWREKPYSSCYTLEGTENLDDRVFEKRHQKLEAEERRQLRWHMRRIREQRHVERLRQRQRDSWCGAASPARHPPAVYTLWQQPQRDARFIEITDALPVVAFGEIIPDLPDSGFMLPWVKTAKAHKRSKRSKTLH